MAAAVPEAAASDVPGTHRLLRDQASHDQADTRRNVPINRYIFITPSTNYWTNWPTEKNPYVLPSTWHRTAGLFINTIQPVAD